HGVAILSVLAAVRTTAVPRHRGAKDRGPLVIEGGVGDRHPQLDGAHDRVGTNRTRASSNLGQRATSVVLVKLGVGTRIVTHRGPTSGHRHDTFLRRSANHHCTLDHEEPLCTDLPVSVAVSAARTPRCGWPTVIRGSSASSISG